MIDFCFFFLRWQLSNTHTVFHLACAGYKPRLLLHTSTPKLHQLSLPPPLTTKKPNTHELSTNQSLRPRGIA